MSLNVGITFDLQSEYLKEGFSEEETAEFDSEETIDSIEQNLRRLGFVPERIGNAKQLLLGIIDGRRWDLVFNICEGLHGTGREALVPSILDNYQIPYTFSDPLALSMALHKGIAKRVMRDIGVITPAFAIVESADDIETVELPFPLFTKPVAEGTSKGIDSSCYVTSHAQLKKTCLRLLRDFEQPVLVERYLPGREFTMGVIGSGKGAEAMGAMEIVLRSEAEPYAYSYRNKQQWETMVEFRAISPEILAACADVGLLAWRGLGCRDAGRVDLREDENGQLNVVEVNPLPGLSEISDLSIVSRLSNSSYPELIKRIMATVLQRIGLDCRMETRSSQTESASA